MHWAYKESGEMKIDTIFINLSVFIRTVIVSNTDAKSILNGDCPSIVGGDRHLHFERKTKNLSSHLPSAVFWQGQNCSKTQVSFHTMSYSHCPFPPP